jgi:hypothetical protein
VFKVRFRHARLSKRRNSITPTLVSPRSS